MLERSLFTSCYASKKRTSEGSERVTFFLHRNSWIKSLILRFSLTDRHISRIGSEQLWKYIVRPIRDTKIVLHGVNLSMYEIKHFVSLYRFLWTLYCFLAYFAVRVFLMFSFFYGEIGAKQTKIGLRVHARRLTAVFSPLRIVRRFSSVLSRSILIV